MSAVVTSDKGEDWFTNSYTWLTVLERAFNALPPEQHDEYDGYATSIGANFELMPAEARPRVARWLLRTVDELLGPVGAEYGWDKERDRAHLAELAAMLRRTADG
ncbi:MAG: hypothetical protein HOW97_36825 [Catenulispora sp.]|nr:hypothetical protein [Catenulispora sp.]